jgi:hypothetical protein
VAAVVLQDEEPDEEESGRHGERQGQGVGHRQAAHHQEPQQRERQAGVEKLHHRRPDAGALVRRQYLVHVCSSNFGSLMGRSAIRYRKTIAPDESSPRAIRTA